MRYDAVCYSVACRLDRMLSKARSIWKNTIIDIETIQTANTANVILCEYRAIVDSSTLTYIVIRASRWRRDGHHVTDEGHDALLLHHTYTECPIQFVLSPLHTSTSQVKSKRKKAASRKGTDGHDCHDMPDVVSHKHASSVNSICGILQSNRYTYSCSRAYITKIKV